MTQPTLDQFRYFFLGTFEKRTPEIEASDAIPEDLLRDGHPSVRFVHLLAPPALLQTRVDNRRGHYMPPALLASQLATLEPLGPDEPGFGVDTDRSPTEVADDVLARLADPGDAANGQQTR